MKTVREYCKELLWGISDLATEARISWPTAARAFAGEKVLSRTRRDICSALSSALHRRIKVTDVDWQQEED